MLDMKNPYSTLLYALLFIWLIVMYSCGRDEIYEGNDIDIATSIDTLLFDTVFTEVGSVTRSFKLYNDLDKPVGVDVILEGGSSSFFRINADGIPVSEINQVTIQANDSVYVFVEVTIDPDQPISISPYIVEDRVLVRGGDQEVIVHLEAFGQNANYVGGKNIESIVNLCANGDVVWDDPKPYVIYGILAIQECELLLTAGTDIFVHGGLVINREDSITYNAGRIITLPGGSIRSMGTADSPVTIQSDRLEMEFQDIAGQWFGVVLNKGSANSYFEHTIIKDAIYSMFIDSVDQVDFHNVQFKNSLSVGLFASQSKTNITNSLIYSAGSYGVYYHYGGGHNITFSTIASYTNQTEAIRMQNYLCTDPLCLGDILTNPLTTRITNTIISGASDDEILIDEFDGGDAFTIDYHIDNSLVRVEDLLETYPNFFDHCNNCINYDGTDTLFIDVNENNYDLDSLSIAVQKATSISGINSDLLGRSRSGTPDIGCYESQFK